MRAGWLLIGLWGCNEYQVKPEPGGPVGGGDPEIAATPDAISLSGLCASTTDEVIVQNEGDGDLTIAAVRVEGDGWSVSPPPLPLVLKPGEGTAMIVESGGGSATLIVESDDADEPSLSVPLLATENAAPTVSVLSPGPGEVWPEGADIVLSGTVADDADPAETLALSWSSASELLSTDPAAADGTTELPWAAADRAPGPLSVTLSATDACGATGSVTVDACQDGAFAYDPLALSSWHYEGAARWDETAEVLELTAVVENEVGSAFETSRTVDAGLVDIEFAFYIGGGSGADGLSLTVLDAARMSTWLGGTGCGMGYGGDASCTAGPALPGWTLEVDTYYNEGFDATAEDHLAFTFDGNVAAPALTVPLTGLELEDSGWHLMSVSVLAPRVVVAIDGVTWIDQDIAGNYAFSGYVGFTAGTGSLTNSHLIDGLEVTDYACE